MSKWQKGQYNSDYILHHRNIVGQLKFETRTSPARLDEISIEKYDNGDMCILFTTHPDATNDSKQGGVHARLAYNTLFQELQREVIRSDLEYVTSNLEEVHKLKGRKGQERALLQILVLLEEYDNTLSEISSTLRHYIAPERASLEDLTDEISLQEQRLSLLKQVLAKEATGAGRKTTARSRFAQKTMARRRGKTTAKRSKKRA